MTKAVCALGKTVSETRGSPDVEPPPPSPPPPAAVTVRVAVAEIMPVKPFIVAVMVVVPAETAVASPDGLTVATA